MCCTTYSKNSFYHIFKHDKNLNCKIFSVPIFWEVLILQQLGEFPCVRTDMGTWGAFSYLVLLEMSLGT